MRYQILPKKFLPDNTKQIDVGIIDREIYECDSSPSV